MTDTPEDIEARLRQVAEDIAADRGISFEDAVAVLREGLISAMAPPLATP